jgi:hypothetical protein
VSTRVIVEAELGPALEATSVYVMVAPAATGSGLSVMVTAMSAVPETVVPWVSELFAGTGSDVVAATVAVCSRSCRPSRERSR